MRKMSVTTNSDGDLFTAPTATINHDDYANVFYKGWILTSNFC
jgi:hypothetical protein